jgi:lipid-binding SYLF domain-containing protein
LFAGINLSGGVLRPDTKADEAFYGRSVSPRDLLAGKGGLATPSAARPFVAALSGAPASAAKR